ncbi:unnamed protein product [Discosporangium mesarthrocarpum]
MQRCGRLEITLSLSSLLLYSELWSLCPESEGISQKLFCTLAWFLSEFFVLLPHQDPVEVLVSLLQHCKTVVPIQCSEATPIAYLRCEGVSDVVHCYYDRDWSSHLRGSIALRTAATPAELQDLQFQWSPRWQLAQERYPEGRCGCYRLHKS